MAGAGLRIADAVEVHWASIFAGVGCDLRSSGESVGARISRAAGIPEAEVVLGVLGVRRLRDAAPPTVRGLFEVIGAHGGIRLPLDTVLAPDHVRPALTAIAVARRLAGVQMVLAGDAGTVFTMTVAVLGDPVRFAKDSGGVRDEQ